MDTLCRTSHKYIDETSHGQLIVLIIELSMDFMYIIYIHALNYFIIYAITQEKECLVLWEGYGNEDASWVDTAEVTTDALRYF